MRTVNHNIVNGLHLFDGHGERCGILFSGNLPTHIYRDGGSVHVQLNVQNPDAWTIGAFFFFFFIVRFSTLDWDSTRGYPTTNSRPLLGANG